jgi:hypothetical protein
MWLPLMSTPSTRSAGEGSPEEGTSEARERVDSPKGSCSSGGTPLACRGEEASMEGGHRTRTKTTKEKNQELANPSLGDGQANDGGRSNGAGGGTRRSTVEANYGEQRPTLDYGDTGTAQDRGGRRRHERQANRGMKDLEQEVSTPARAPGRADTPRGRSPASGQGGEGRMSLRGATATRRRTEQHVHTEGPEEPSTNS